MAKCKWCNKKGLFVFVSEDGLCKNCAPSIILEVNGSARIIKESLNIVYKSKKLETKTSRCRLIIDYATRLLKYEQKGIETIDPFPSELIEDIKTEHDDSIDSEFFNMFEEISNKIKTLSSVNSKVNLYIKMLEKLRKYKNQTFSKNNLEEYEKSVLGIITDIKYCDYLDKGQKYEINGNIEKSFSIYNDAINMIKTNQIDDTDPAKKIQLDYLKSKIEQIKGKIKNI